MKTTRTCLAVVATLGFLTSMPAPAVQKKCPKLKVNSAARIYLPATYSDQKTYKKLGSVTSRKVFDATAEYKQIEKRKLSPNTAEWSLLTKVASDKFKKAVSKTADDGGYDLIAEAGAVTLDEGAIPDITSDVLAQLPAD